jgi:hypothetical protein
MSVAKVTEISATSTKIFEEAITQGIESGECQDSCRKKNSCCLILT